VKVKLTKIEGPQYMILPFFVAAQKMVEDLAPTAVAVQSGSVLYIEGEDDEEVKTFTGHILAMSPFFLKQEIVE
jgi:hypothetical protein